MQHAGGQFTDNTAHGIVSTGIHRNTAAIPAGLYCAATRNASHHNAGLFRYDRDISGVHTAADPVVETADSADVEGFAGSIGIHHSDLNGIGIGAVGDGGAAAGNTADMAHAKSRSTSIDGDVDLSARQMHVADGGIFRAAEQTDVQGLRINAVFAGDGHACDVVVLTVVASGKGRHRFAFFTILVYHSDGRPIHPGQVNICRLDVVAGGIIPDGIQLLGIGHPIGIVHRAAAAVKDQRSRLFPQENDFCILMEGVFADGDRLFIGVDGDRLQISAA